MRLANATERLTLSLLAFFVTFAATAFLFPVLDDGDTWWHLGAGRWIVQELAVPTTDPFSFSRPGAPWHAHEWGAEVLMWAAYAAGGLAGLVALTATVAAAAAALLAYHLQRHLAPPLAILVTTIAVLCLLPSILARPHLIALPIFVIWTDVLLGAREKDRAPPLALAALMVVWANVHGSFLLGLLLVGALGLEAVLASNNRKSSLAGWAAFGLLSSVAALLTPFGPGGFLFPFQVSSMDSLRLITEWAPSTVQQYPVFFIATIGTIATFLSVGVKFPPLRALVFAGLLFMAMSHVGHLFVFAFIGWMFAAEPLGRALRKGSGQRDAAPGRTDRFVTAGLGMACAIAILVRLALPVPPEARHRLPIGLIERVPPELRRMPVFNSYSFGGPLVFAGIRPFIDGRADMYGDAFVREYHDAERGSEEAWQRIAARYDIKWTILRPRSPLVAQLEREGWRKILDDERAVVHVQASPPPNAEYSNP
jgi:hypothetical protein